jgi:hypothetical protein
MVKEKKEVWSRLESKKRAFHKGGSHQHDECCWKVMWVKDQHDVLNFTTWRPFGDLKIVISEQWKCKLDQGGFKKEMYNERKKTNGKGLGIEPTREKAVGMG